MPYSIFPQPMFRVAIFAAILLTVACNDPTANKDTGTEGTFEAAIATGTFTAKIGLDGLGLCAGIELTVVGPNGSHRVTSATDGAIEVTGVGSGNYSFQAAADGYELIDHNETYTGSPQTQDFGEILLAPESVPLAGNIELSDGANPAGSLVSITGSTDMSVPNGLECTTGDGETEAFEEINALVNSRGEYQARVPRRGRDVRVRGTRTGYTETELDVDDAAIRNASEDAPVSVSALTLYPLTGFVNIADGKSVRNSTLVPLQISAFNLVSEMAVGETVDGTCTYADWQPYQALTSYTITELDGQHTICVSVRNDKGQTLTDLKTQVTLDRTAPSGALTINGGDGGTTSALVVLTVIAGDSGSGVQGIRLANTQGGLATTSTVAYETTKLWSLADSGTEELKTVWLRVIDQAGNSSTAISSQIVYDATPPNFTVAVTSTDGVPGLTSTRVVWLALTHDADADQMRISNSSTFSDANWVPVDDGLSWVLAPGDGNKQIYVSVRDAAENSTNKTTSIVLDQTPPNTPGLQVLDIDGDDFALSETDVELQWTVPSSTAQFDLQRLQAGIDSDFVTIAEPGAETSTRRDPVTTPGVLHQYRIRAVDALGNISPWSAVASARPFSPIREVFRFRGSAGTEFQMTPNTGMFSLSGRYEYEKPDRTTVSESIPDNQTSWTRDPLGTERRYNEKLVIRSANQDNSLVYESQISLGGGVRELLSQTCGSSNDIAVDRDGYVHVVCYHVDNLGDVDYFTNASGDWVRSTIEAGDTVGLNPQIAVDKDNQLHAIYQQTAVDTLRYATNSGAGWNISTVSSEGREPKMKLDVDGNVHVVAENFSTGGVDYYTNAGGGWSSEEVTSDGNDPDLALDADGNVHVAFVDSFQILYRLKSSGMWQHVETVDGGALRRTPSIAVDGKGTAHIAYQYDPGASAELRYAQNASGSWSHQQIDSGGGNTGEKPRIVIDASGAPHIVYTGPSSDRYLNHANGALGWATTVLDEAKYTSRKALTIDEQGVMYVVYGSSFGLGYLRFGEPGDVYTVDDSANNVGRSSDLAIDGDGNIHISYADISDLTLRYASNSFGTFTNVTVATDQQYGQTGIALGDDGVIHLSYVSESSDELRYVTGNTSNWSMVTVENSIAVGYYQDMILDQTGTPHLVYHDNTNNDLEYAVQDGGGWLYETIDNDSSVGYQANITIAATGRVHVAYQKLGSFLRYASGEFGAFTTEDVDAGNVGHGAEIVLDREGYIHIFHQDQGNSELRYSNNTGGVWTSIVLDGDGTVGSHIDAAVDKNNKLHVCYYSQSAGGLKYLTNQTGTWTGGIVTAISQGSHTSMAVDRNNQPVCAFYASIPLDLQMVRGFSGWLNDVEASVVSPF